MRLLALAAMVAAIPTVQSSSVIGVWTAQFNGTTFVTLELHSQGGTLAGTINMGDIQVDDKGELRHVGGLHADALVVSDASQQGLTVRFSAKEEDDTDQFELQLRDDGHAELRLMPSEAFKTELADAGVGIPKPIVLTRQAR